MSANLRTMGTPVYTSTNVSASGSLSPTLPARSTGDLLLLFAWSESTSFAVTTPSGWTPLLALNHGSSSTGGRVVVLGREVDGTETNPTVSYSGLTGGNSGTPAGVVIASYMDADLSNGVANVLDGSPTIQSNAASKDIAMQAFTTGVGDSYIINIGVKPASGNAPNWTPPANWTEILDTNTASGADMTSYIFTRSIGAAGSTATATATGANTATSANVSVMFALKPFIPTAHEVNVNDTLTPLDSVVTAERGFQTTADSLLVVDDLTTTEHMFGAVPDDLLVVDDLAAVQQHKALADTLALSDSAVTQRAIDALLGDTLVVADAASAARGVEVPVGDTLVVTDAQSASLGRSVALADALALDDAIALARAVQTSIADSAGVSDTVALMRDVQQAVADTMVVADAITGLERSLAASVTDVLVLSDDIGKDIRSLLADALAVSDEALPVIGGAYVHVDPPLSGLPADAALGGLVLAVVSGGSVTIIDATGVIVTVDAAGNVVPGTASGVVDPYVGGGS